MSIIGEYRKLCRESLSSIMFLIHTRTHTHTHTCVSCHSFAISRQEYHTKERTEVNSLLCSPHSTKQEPHLMCIHSHRLIYIESGDEILCVCVCVYNKKKIHIGVLFLSLSLSSARPNIMHACFMPQLKSQLVEVFNYVFSHLMYLTPFYYYCCRAYCSSMLREAAAVCSGWETLQRARDQREKVAE
jgi:hypothetical protein